MTLPGEICLQNLPPKPFGERLALQLHTRIHNRYNSQRIEEAREGAEQTILAKEIWLHFGAACLWTHIDRTREVERNNRTAPATTCIRMCAAEAYPPQPVSQVYARRTINPTNPCNLLTNLRLDSLQQQQHFRWSQRSLVLCTRIHRHRTRLPIVLFDAEVFC